MVTVKLTSNTKLMLITIYRLQFISAPIFIKEFTEFLEMLSVIPENFVLSGDINFHLETDDHYSKLIKDLFNNFNLVQHVDFPTHREGHTLDLVLTRNSIPKITNLMSNNVHLSDHYILLFDVEAEILKHEDKVITYRDLKAIDNIHFSEEVKQKLQVTTASSFGERISEYNKVMKELVDRFAPLKTKSIKIVSKAPWFDSEYVELRKRRRKAEKRYKSTKLEVDKKAFVDLRKQTTALAFQKKREHYASKISNCNSTKKHYEIRK